MRTKTGIFGGTFNPIHIGHLALANYLCEFGGLDELWFMVSPQNPLKDSSMFLTDLQRLALVQAAIKEYPKFRASDFEFGMPRPSYTINTMDALKGTYASRDFSLIMGSDNWMKIDRWKDYNRLIAENNILIYPRPDFPVDENTLPTTAKLVNAPLLDISSTFVRESIAVGKDIRYFLHPSTHELLGH